MKLDIASGGVLAESGVDGGGTTCSVPGFGWEVVLWFAEVVFGSRAVGPLVTGVLWPSEAVSPVVGECGGCAELPAAPFAGALPLEELETVDGSWLPAELGLPAWAGPLGEVALSVALWAEELPLACELPGASGACGLFAMGLLVDSGLPVAFEPLVWFGPTGELGLLVDAELFADPLLPVPLELFAPPASVLP
ncbi:hypothetical protein [Amycolatopsis orientalis]|uniref:hypothetical protein n=1 Tax=Amycolatopsis orientalis TaxID=31958 RepID=UPI000569946D|nr:hypothetical protein [Amycolatopsis orientalis]